MKVKFTDKAIWQEFFKILSIVASLLSITFIFIDISSEKKTWAGILVIIVFVLLYLGLWWKYNSLKSLKLVIDGSKVWILTGDLFEQQGLKTIAFNEYFDTQVDDKIISKRSLNGIYIEKYSNKSVEELDLDISSYQFDDEQIGENLERLGKSKKYKLGTVCVLDEYLLVAFSKFDSQDKAVLTMPEYLEFLINFWDNVNRVYSQKSVTVPIFGSGITRIKEHKNINDEELLKIMLWTFRISEMRFQHPAKLRIIIHQDKIDSINLLNIKSADNGL
jgi:hypothetical protein